MQIDRRLISNFDWALFATAISIPMLGLIVLFSAGYDPDAVDPAFGLIPLFVKSPAFVKQLVFLSVGTGVAMATVLVPPQKLAKLAYGFYSVCFLLLVAVAVHGTVIKGSRRWIDLGPILFQPAEIAKMGVILALARYLSRNPAPKDGFRLKGLLVPFSIFLFPMLLVLKQPDLGTALSIGSIGVSMVFFAGIHLRSLLLLVLCGTALIFPAWNHLHDYQKRRVLVLIDPEADPLGSGYHIIQSKIAVGSGELLGKGFLKGTQTQLQFLPEHSTDFIFSVLAEEWGFFGCFVVLSIYLVLLYRLTKVIRKTREGFSLFLVVGLTAYIYCHVFINIGMVVGLLPVVGIPLPLFSYGGSSMMANMLAIGLALGVSARRKLYHR